VKFVPKLYLMPLKGCEILSTPTRNSSFCQNPKYAEARDDTCDHGPHGFILLFLPSRGPRSSDLGKLLHFLSEKRPVFTGHIHFFLSIHHLTQL